MTQQSRNMQPHYNIIRLVLPLLCLTELHPPSNSGTCLLPSHIIDILESPYNCQRSYSIISEKGSRISVFCTFPVILDPRSLHAARSEGALSTSLPKILVIMSYHKQVVRQKHGFGGLVVSMLASGTKVCGFKPGRSRWIFRA